MRTSFIFLALSLLLLSCAAPKIGDRVDSGYIFHVDPAARITYITPAEPLIVPEVIVSTEQLWMWNNTGNNPVMELRRARGNGRQNTKKIISTLGMFPNKHPYAAAAIYPLSYTSPSGRIYDDWFLPSIGELGILLKAYAENSGGLKEKIKPHVGNDFWSSSWGEVDPSKIFASKLVGQSVSGYEADKGEAKAIWPIRQAYY